MSIRRLNHAVLYVRNAHASADFYTRVLGFRVRAAMGDQALNHQRSAIRMPSIGQLAASSPWPSDLLWALT